MERLWPGAIVMENSLQVHAGAIRKALGPYRSLLKTEFGRGYRLLGDWTVRHRDEAKPSVGLQQRRAIGEPPATHNFPASITPLIGRSAAVQSLQDPPSAYPHATPAGPRGRAQTAPP